MKPLSGHALRREGGPFDEQGRYLGDKYWYATVAGDGHALCECGAMSDVLPSSNQRRAWHRQHKAAVRGEQ